MTEPIETGQGNMDILRRLQALEERVARLEGAKTPGPKRDGNAITREIMNLMDELLEQQRHGKPRGNQYLDYLKIAVFQRAENFAFYHMVISDSKSYEDLFTVDDNLIAEVASSFVNPARVRLIKSLLAGDKTSSELSQDTGIEGGQLYHHFRELARAKFISRDSRGVYKLSHFGRQMAITFLFETHVVESQCRRAFEDQLVTDLGSEDTMAVPPESKPQG